MKRLLILTSLFLAIQLSAQEPNDTSSQSTSTEVNMQIPHDDQINQKIDPQGIWVSLKSGGYFDIMSTPDGFTCLNIINRESWAKFKKQDTNEYICSEVKGKIYTDDFIGTTIITYDSAHLTLTRAEQPAIRWEKIPGLKKDHDGVLVFEGQPFTKVYGGWNSSSGSNFVIHETDEGIKMQNPDYPSSWAYYKESYFPKFECYDVSGRLYGESYIGSVIVFHDTRSLTIYPTTYKQAYSWIKKQNYTYNDEGDIFVDGLKIATVKKTARGSIMMTTMPEFTIYDVHGTPYLRFNQNNGKLYFLDDYESYIPRQCDAKIGGSYGLAKFIGSELLFTPEGFDKEYRAKFISKYNGFNATGPTKTTRDKSDPVRIEGFEILQSNMVIGSLKCIGEMWKDQECAVGDANNNFVARISIINKEYNMVDVDIYLGDSDDPIHTFNKLTSLSLTQQAVEWLVENGHL